jgi:hypothetical protein
VPSSRLRLKRAAAPWLAVADAKELPLGAVDALAILLRLHLAPELCKDIVAGQSRHARVQDHPVLLLLEACVGFLQSHGVAVGSAVCDAYLRCSSNLHGLYAVGWEDVSDCGGSFCASAAGCERRPSPAGGRRRCRGASAAFQSQLCPQLRLGLFRFLGGVCARGDTLPAVSHPARWSVGPAALGCCSHWRCST